MDPIRPFHEPTKNKQTCSHQYYSFGGHDIQVFLVYSHNSRSFQCNSYIDGHHDTNKKKIYQKSMHKFVVEVTFFIV